MKFISLFLTSFLFCSASFANFQYHFKCRGDGRNQLLDLKVGANGLEEVTFKYELKRINAYQLLSQYCDYGSMQFMWQDSAVADKKATLHLEFSSGTRWMGQLTFDGQEQVDLMCIDQL
ncbi:hypothetical protein [Bdellovibrio svalbardensis]|uniref:Uncharacterized protein n=1 Tax=Bdellovibrio svalbardensis TaxID=2972972 RepID=A0ABT6DMI2_9BACT|nr:hypothetical protein [Bdellovibrio svalbardensis]MDG0817824.1 hypothetical protein [Bdellovibrio svalbardensis]